uniref:RNA-directed DNA polymerase n=1 Tax=Heterorhabditis bacteriophora TaxID=37862 RepID=A0A1I7XH92_HETBA
MAINITIDQLQEVIKATVMAIRGTEASPVPTTFTTTEVTRYISNRIVDFTYDPDNGCTFEIWYQRYEDFIKIDGSCLDDFAQARIVTSKLDQTVYAKFSNHILPRKVNSLGLEETVNVLRTLFGYKRSTFYRRIHCLQTERRPTDDLHTYAGIVNHRCEMFDRTNLTDDQFKLHHHPHATAVDKITGSKTPHTESTCHKCGRTGHLAKVCEKQRKPITKKRNIQAVIASNHQEHLKTRRKFLAMKINGQPLKMQLDTGADITMVNQTAWKKIGAPKLDEPSISARTADGKQLPLLGVFTCTYEYNNFRVQGQCHVAETTQLLGLDWINSIPELCNPIEAICCHVPTISLDLVNRFPGVFKTGLGHCTRIKAHIQTKPNATPVFRKTRPEIDRLVAQNVIYKVDHSEWAAPVVAVSKKDGSIRLCADFSTGLNDATEPHNHPLPTTEEIDLAEAYLQVEVDEDSKKILTLNTHRGLFRYNRLPFGVKAAPGIFQQIMDSMLTGLSGATAYLDDLIVCGSTIDEYNQRLEDALSRIEEYGLRVKLDKCNFLQTQINYLGFIINQDGRKPDPKKTIAISRMPPPQDCAQLRSFLGLINYYGSFVPMMHNLRAPLDALLKKDVQFKWSVKEILSSNLLLTHFDSKENIVIAADASNYGIGAVISHRYKNGTEKAIYHVSRTLTAIEKEELALVFAVRKFHRFIFGRPFTLLTDHKPLLAIFGSKKGVPVISANRLQRWATMLLYRATTSFGQADALSRLIETQQESRSPEETVIAAVDADIVAEFESHIRTLPITATQIQKATRNDKLLSRIMEFTIEGNWPKITMDSPEWCFFNRRESLSTIQNCLFFGHRIVILGSFQRRVLLTLHEGHPGMSRMKMLARSHVYWPHIDNHIEKFVRNCSRCVAASKNPRKAELNSWPNANEPWARIHIDFAGPLEGRSYLVVVDAYSKWPEVFEMTSTSTGATIATLHKLFAQFGNPETLDFCKARGIDHIRSPPYHPQSNGQAERFVDTFKRALIKQKGERTTSAAIMTFLQTYRSSPCPSISDYKSPAELFIGRRIRTTIDLLKPTKNHPRTRNKLMEQQFNSHHVFNIDEHVYAMDLRTKQSKWTSKIGHVLYELVLDGNTIRRHANQLKHRNRDTIMEDIDFPLSSTKIDELPDQSGRNTAEEGKDLVSSTLHCSPARNVGISENKPMRIHPTRSRGAPSRLEVNPHTRSYIPDRKN